MDGTMIDNMMVHHKIWQKLLAELGMDFSFEEVQQQIHGVNIEILERLFGDRFTKNERIELSRRKEETYRRLYALEIKLIDGLPEFIQQIQKLKIPMGIGTAAPKENLDFVLDALDLRETFKVALHAGDVEKGKPHPEIYQKVAAGLHLSPKECVVFEDSPTGAEAAMKADSKIIVVTTTHRIEEFDHLQNIMKFVDDYNDVSLKDLMV